MKVKLLSIMAGPKGHRDAGTILDVDAKEGKELIDGGYAVAYEEPEAGEQIAVEARTPNNEQAGEFGRRSMPLEKTTAKHPNAEEAVKVEHKAHK